MKESIVLDPLHHFKGTRQGMIHSDRGSQYRSYAFQDYLERHPITHSVSEMKVFIHDYLSEYYPNKRIHTKFKLTPKQFKENLFMSSNAL